jgi:hypothetical protein
MSHVGCTASGPAKHSDGEIVTLHKIRTVVTGGKLQITRCTDDACVVIRAKLMK